MPETLLSSSSILLYGRLLEDLEIKPALRMGPGTNRFLEDQLTGTRKKDGKPVRPKLARIYAFSFEGHNYDLPKPAIFLVDHDGDEAEVPPSSTSATAHSPTEPRGPDDTDKTGVASQPYSFSADMRVWRYDKDDLSIRLDLETGTFDQILLEAQLRPEKRGSYSGAEAKIAGAEARISGAEARISGAEARIRNRGRWSD